MKSVREVLYSPGFKREVSILLFVNAIVTCLCSVVILAASPCDPALVVIGIVGFILAIVWLVLAIVIRRGSTKALTVVGVFFGLDTLLIFTLPLEQTTATILLWRVFLISLLVRYVRRQRIVTN